MSIILIQKNRIAKLEENTINQQKILENCYKVIENYKNQNKKENEARIALIKIGELKFSGLFRAFILLIKLKLNIK